MQDAELLPRFHTLREAEGRGCLYRYHRAEFLNLTHPGKLGGTGALSLKRLDRALRHLNVGELYDWTFHAGEI